MKHHTTRILHACEKNNWNILQPKTARTLILGSFNPYNSKLKDHTDFYYGRIPKGGGGNRLWSIIGKIKYQNPHHFRENLENKIKELNVSGFMFLDLIKSIEFDCQNENVLIDYVEKKVLKNFGDNDIWKTKTKYLNEKIKLTRNYNKEIIDVLNNSSSIDTVLNTMGKTRGDLNFNLRDSNWVNFKNEITEICDSKNIRIIEDSVSPAPQGKSEKDLIHWVKKYILN